MVYFTNIKPTEHYLEKHSANVPWDKVLEIILTTKNPRKKKSKIEYENDGKYVLCELKDKTLWVINAK